MDIYSSDLKIPKVKKEVEMLVNDGVKFPQRYIVYLDPFSKYHDRCESLSEHFNNCTGFIPASQIVSKDETRFTAINCDSIFYVRDKVEIENPLISDSIMIILSNNVKVHAGIPKLHPKGYERVIDHLNLSPRFIELIVDNKYMYVNKSLIIKVYEVGKSIYNVQ